MVEPDCVFWQKGSFYKAAFFAIFGSENEGLTTNS